MLNMDLRAGSNAGFRLTIHFNKILGLYVIKAHVVQIDVTHGVTFVQDGAVVATVATMVDAVNFVTAFPDP